jgi:hypothetical protein
MTVENGNAHSCDYILYTMFHRFFIFLYLVPKTFCIFAASIANDVLSAGRRYDF